MIVSLDGNIDDDSRDIKGMLGKLAPIHAAEVNHKWKLNCRDCRYLGPWAASVLYAVYLHGTELHQRPRVQLPSHPAALSAFCFFSGLAMHLANGQKPDPDHPDCETVPVKRFTAASWNLSDGIIRLLGRHMELDREREEQIRTCVQEVTQNIIDHSASSIGGVLSARYIESRSEVRVGIVDRGLGIAETLRRTHPDTSTSSHALDRVIKGGFSSKSRPNNMGCGVSNLFALVKSAGGNMALFTGDAYAEVHGSMPKPEVRLTGFNFPGTAVFFALPVTA